MNAQMSTQDTSSMKRERPPDDPKYADESLEPGSKRPKTADLAPSESKSNPSPSVPFQSNDPKLQLLIQQIRNVAQTQNNEIVFQFIQQFFADLTSVRAPHKPDVFKIKAFRSCMDLLYPYVPNVPQIWQLLIQLLKPIQNDPMPRRFVDIAILASNLLYESFKPLATWPVDLFQSLLDDGQEAKPFWIEDDSNRIFVCNILTAIPISRATDQFLDDDESSKLNTTGSTNKLDGKVLPLALTNATSHPEVFNRFQDEQLRLMISNHVEQLLVWGYTELMKQVNPSIPSQLNPSALPLAIGIIRISSLTSSLQKTREMASRFMSLFINNPTTQKSAKELFRRICVNCCEESDWMVLTSFATMNSLPYPPSISTFVLDNIQVGLQVNSLARRAILCHLFTVPNPIDENQSLSFQFDQSPLSVECVLKSIQEREKLEFELASVFHLILAQSCSNASSLHPLSQKDPQQTQSQSVSFENIMRRVKLFKHVFRSETLLNVSRLCFGLFSDATDVLNSLVDMEHRFIWVQRMVHLATTICLLGISPQLYDLNVKTGDSGSPVLDLANHEGDYKDLFNSSRFCLATMQAACVSWVRDYIPRFVHPFRSSSPHPSVNPLNLIRCCLYLDNPSLYLWNHVSQPRDQIITTQDQIPFLFYIIYSSPVSEQLLLSIIQCTNSSTSIPNINGTNNSTDNPLISSLEALELIEAIIVRSARTWVSSLSSSNDSIENYDISLGNRFNPLKIESESFWPIFFGLACYNPPISHINLNGDTVHLASLYHNKLFYEKRLWRVLIILTILAAFNPITIATPLYRYCPSSCSKHLISTTLTKSFDFNSSKPYTKQQIESAENDSKVTESIFLALTLQNHPLPDDLICIFNLEDPHTNIRPPVCVYEALKSYDKEFGLSNLLMANMPTSYYQDICSSESLEEHIEWLGPMIQSKQGDNLILKLPIICNFSILVFLLVNTEDPLEQTLTHSMYLKSRLVIQIKQQITEQIQSTEVMVVWDSIFGHLKHLSNQAVRIMIYNALSVLFCSFSRSRASLKPWTWLEDLKIEPFNSSFKWLSSHLFSLLHHEQDPQMVFRLLEACISNTDLVATDNSCQKFVEDLFRLSKTNPDSNLFSHEKVIETLQKWMNHPHTIQGLQNKEANNQSANRTFKWPFSDPNDSQIKYVDVPFDFVTFLLQVCMLDCNPQSQSYSKLFSPLRGTMPDFLELKEILMYGSWLITLLEPLDDLEVIVAVLGSSPIKSLPPESLALLLHSFECCLTISSPKHKEFLSRFEESLKNPKTVPSWLAELLPNQELESSYPKLFSLLSTIPKEITSSVTQSMKSFIPNSQYPYQTSHMEVDSPPAAPKKKGLILTFRKTSQVPSSHTGNQPYNEYTTNKKDISNLIVSNAIAAGGDLRFFDDHDIVDAENESCVEDFMNGTSDARSLSLPNLFKFVEHCNSDWSKSVPSNRSLLHKMVSCVNNIIIHYDQDLQTLMTYGLQLRRWIGMIGTVLLRLEPQIGSTDASIAIELEQELSRIESWSNSVIAKSNGEESFNFSVPFPTFHSRQELDQFIWGSSKPPHRIIDVMMRRKLDAALDVIRKSGNSGDASHLFNQFIDSYGSFHENHVIQNNTKNQTHSNYLQELILDSISKILKLNNELLSVDLIRYIFSSEHQHIEIERKLSLITRLILIESHHLTQKSLQFIFEDSNTNHHCPGVHNHNSNDMEFMITNSNISKHLNPQVCLEFLARILPFNQNFLFNSIDSMEVPISDLGPKQSLSSSEQSIHMSSSMVCKIVDWILQESADSSPNYEHLNSRCDLLLYCCNQNHPMLLKSCIRHLIEMPNMTNLSGRNLIDEITNLATYSNIQLALDPEYLFSMIREMKKDGMSSMNATQSQLMLKPENAAGEILLQLIYNRSPWDVYESSKLFTSYLLTSPNQYQNHSHIDPRLHSLIKKLIHLNAAPNVHLHLRKLAVAHPSLVIRFLPSISALLKGKLQCSLDEFLNTKLFVVFHNILSVLEVLIPLLFVDASSKEPLIDIMDEYFNALNLASYDSKQAYNSGPKQKTTAQAGDSRLNEFVTNLADFIGKFYKHPGISNISHPYLESKRQVVENAASAFPNLSRIQQLSHALNTHDPSLMMYDPPLDRQQIQFMKSSLNISTTQDGEMETFQRIRSTFLDLDRLVSLSSHHSIILRNLIDDILPFMGCNSFLASEFQAPSLLSKATISNSHAFNSIIEQVNHLAYSLVSKFLYSFPKEGSKAVNRLIQLLQSPHPDLRSLALQNAPMFHAYCVTLSHQTEILTTLVMMGKPAQHAVREILDPMIQFAFNP